MLEVFGLQLHFYGLIIGLALVIAISLIEKYHQDFAEVKWKKLISEKFFWQLIFIIISSGIIGARAWHVATDWHLYQSDLLASFKIWNGGLSILGAILGGVIGMAWYLFFRYKNAKDRQQVFLYILDISILGLPLAQAIGRLGNYINQELYGLPTNLPWAIYISPERRVVGFENFSYFHPLFLYELFFTGLFALVIWSIILIRKGHFKIINFNKIIGTGKLFQLYLIYYLVIRFFLDFLRIDKALFLGSVFGLNQIIILVIISIWLSYFSYSHFRS